MSNAGDPQPAPTTPATTYPKASSWVGWIAFAGVMMALVGSFHVVQGLVALFDDDIFVVAESGLLVSVSYTTWGWVHVIGGVVLVIAGLCVFGGQVWARAVGVVLALASAMTSLGFMGAYPLWAVVVIALDIVIVLALTVHGSDIKP
jgi:hypothetical protein